MVVVEGAGPAGKKRTLEASVTHIDKTLRAQWKKAGITRARPAGDEAFIRRVTLDVAGRIPTPDEIDAFIADTSERRREKLIDRLIASDDYAAHWSDVYMDVLFSRADRAKVRYADAPHDYLAEAFAANEPFDDLAIELISATGDRSTNEATAFVLSYRPGAGRVELLAGDTARVFLGVGIQCAQCHDHPYDERYTKRDFAAFAANFAQVSTRAFDDPLFGRVVDLSDTDKARGPYKNDVPELFGVEITRRDGESRRRALARAITESKLFSLVTVNRTWAQMFGRAIVSPWDDLGGENDDRHTPLLRKLAEDFRTHGYDHARLVKLIALTQAYGLSSIGGSSEKSDDDAVEASFARASVRLLSPDQLLRSHFTATGLEEAIIKRAGADKAAARRAQLLAEYLFSFSDDGDTAVDAFTGNVPQVLLLRNGVATNRGVRARRDTVVWNLLHETDDAEERIGALFRLTYSREPSSEELARLVEHVQQHDGATEAYEDVFHALLTSTEFVTNH